MAVLKIIITIFILFCMSTIAIRKTVIILERAIVKYYDPEYFGIVSASVTKLNRASNYRFDFNMTIKHPMYNNITVGVKNYELQSNVYKEGIINMEQPLCQAIKNKFYQVLLYNNSNLGDNCPLKDYFYVKNLEPSMGDLPLVVPPSKYRFDFFIYQRVEKKRITEMDVYIRTEEKITKVKSKNGIKRLKNKPQM